MLYYTVKKLVCNEINSLFPLKNTKQ